MTGMALEGIRVVECTQFEVGTVCGQTLGWMGADVIKVERPGKGDPSRTYDLFFATLNSSKRSVVIDLKAERGRQAFLDIVKTADVVVENLGPGVFERLGLGYETLQTTNPRVVFARGKGFGTYGEYSSYKAFDMIAQATSAAMAATGEADGPPLMERFPVADHATGIHLALGVMAALWQRQSTGEGQQVEVSMQDAMLSMGRMWFSHFIAGRPYPRRGNRSMAGDLYPTAGGAEFDYAYVLATRNRPMWRALAETIGRPDLADPDPAGDPRGDVDEEMIEAVRAWVATRDKFEVMRILGEAGVPVGAVLSGQDVLADPHVRSRDMVVTFEDTERGPVTMMGAPIKLSASAPNITPPPFVLGGHTDEVLAEVGYSEADIASLRDDGAI